MHKEIEVKLKYKNKEKVVNKILEKSGKFLEKYSLSDTYFGKGRDMSNSNELLRVREKGDYKELTFKGKCKNSGNIWERTELTVEIKDAEIMKKILEKTGMKFIKINNSVREYYSLFSCEIIFVEILKPSYLEFMEVEGDKNSIKKVLKTLKGLAEEVGEDIFKNLD